MATNDIYRMWGYKDEEASVKLILCFCFKLCEIWLVGYIRLQIVHGTRQSGRYKYRSAHGLYNAITLVQREGQNTYYLSVSAISPQAICLSESVHRQRQRPQHKVSSAKQKKNYYYKHHVSHWLTENQNNLSIFFVNHNVFIVWI